MTPYLEINHENYHTLLVYIRPPNNRKPIDALARTFFSGNNYLGLVDRRYNQDGELIHPDIQPLRKTTVTSLPKKFRETIGLSEELHNILMVIENVGIGTRAYKDCVSWFMRKYSQEYSKVVNMMHAFDLTEHIAHDKICKNNDPILEFGDAGYVAFMNEIALRPIGERVPARSYNYDSFHMLFQVKNVR